MDEVETVGATTRAEIFQQPALWQTTIDRVREFDLSELDLETLVVVTGAGTSAHAAEAIASAWPGARAVATTDLLTDSESIFNVDSILISVARSGDSPESVGVVQRVQKLHPSVRHYAVTCNPEGRLANHPGVNVLRLDPRTNDRSLVMTSSFSNLVLAGLAFKHLPALEHAIHSISVDANRALEEFDETAKTIAALQFSRAVILTSSHLTGLGRETALKILELTAGQIAVIPETYLGLRHGPMSFLREDTLVLCFLSSSQRVRRYEVDLLEELRAKRLGYIVAVTPAESDRIPVAQRITAIASGLPDHLRTPFEIIFGQLLGYYLSLKAGLDPDNPSPGGVINRVVQGVRIYED
jgi:tagatose-6-phosphate ketose/aldose isomerase